MASRNMGSKDKARRKQTTYQRQNGICAYCNNKIAYDEWTLDHVVPLEKGGTNRLTNLVGSCSPCNQEKGSSLNKLKSRDRKKYMPKKIKVIRNGKVRLEDYDSDQF